MSGREPRTSRRLFARNTLLGVLSWLVPIIPTFVATPIVFERLGAAEYGLLVTLIGFISYFFTTALGRVAAKYVAEYRATGESELIPQVISATLVLGTVITLAGVLATVLLARTLVADALRIPVDMQEKAVSGLYIACATIVLVVIAQVFQMVLQGIHRFGHYFLIANLSSMSFSLGGIVLVLLGYGVFGLLWWNLITWTITCVVSYILARRLLPDLRFTLKIAPHIRTAVFQYSLSIAAYQICGNILLLFERAWVARRFGLEAVSFYVIAMTLAMILHLFVSSLVLAMFPVVNELLADREKLRSLYRRATKIVLGFAGLAIASSVAGGREFLSVWMGPESAANSYILLVIHTATFAILAVSTIAWQIADSFRMPSVNASATFMWMAIGILAMILLPLHLGPAGIALSRFAGVLSFVPAIIYVEKTFLHKIYWTEWILDLALVGLGSVLAGVSIAAILYALPDGWLSLTAAGAAGVLVYIAVLLGCGYLDRSEREMLRSMIGAVR